MRIVRKVYYCFINWILRIATRISPKLNTMILYRLNFGKKWVPENPVSFNDKVLWLKYNTYREDDLVKECADKYLVRKHVADWGCEELLTRLYGVYENPNDIEFDNLPKRFVLKLNVGCKCNYICTNKDDLVKEEVVEKVKKWMKQKYYLQYAEMQYKNVKPHILVEEYLGDEDGTLPEDYKFYCYNGKCKYVMVCCERGKGNDPKFYFMDRNWTLQPYTQEALDNPDVVISKPENIDIAFEYACKLSQGFPFVRVDLYICKGKIYFGELTFTPAAGFDRDFLVIPPNSDKNVDIILGEDLDVNNIHYTKSICK